MKKSIFRLIFLVSLFLCFGMQLQAQEASQLLINRSILSANREATISGSNVPFFVYPAWMKIQGGSSVPATTPPLKYMAMTYAVESAQPYKPRQGLGAAAFLEIKADKWILDSVSFSLLSKQYYYDTSKNGLNKKALAPYERPNLDSLRLVIWKGKPYETGSTIVWSDTNLPAFTVEWPESEIRVAYRQSTTDTNILYNNGVGDSAKAEVFYLKVKLPSIELSQGNYYFYYTMRTTLPNLDIAAISAGRSLVDAMLYAPELPYTGMAIANNRAFSTATGVTSNSNTNVTAYYQGPQLSYALDLWGKVEGAVTKDLSFTDLRVQASCNMSQALASAQIKNIETEEVNLSTLKVYYIIDTTKGSSGFAALTDTIEAEFTLSANTIAANAYVSITDIRKKGTPSGSGIDLGTLGERHRLNLFLRCDEDNFEVNDAISRIIQNTGTDLISFVAGKTPEYKLNYPRTAVSNVVNIGLTQAYPAAYTPATGGWTVLDTIATKTFSAAQGFSWKPAVTAPDAAMDQWLISDCLELEAGASYKIQMAYASKNAFDMELALMDDYDPSTISKSYGKISLAANDNTLQNTAVNVFTIVPTKTGVQHIAFKQVTPVVSGGLRDTLLVNSLVVVKAVSYILNATEISLPPSNCDLSEESTLKITLKNVGYEAARDTVKVNVEITEPNGTILTSSAKIKVSLDALMPTENRGITYTYPHFLDFSKKGTYNVKISLNYGTNGVFDFAIPYNKDVFPEAGQIINNYEKLTTPLARSFKNTSDLANWLDVTDGFVHGAWSMEMGRTYNGPDGTPGCLFGGCPKNTNFGAWYSSSCIELSSDSIYKTTVWVKSDGKASQFEKPTFGLVVSTDQVFNSSDRVIVEKNVYKDTTWTKIEGEFQVATSGLHYIGFNYRTFFQVTDSVNYVLVADFDLRGIGNPKDSIIVVSSDLLFGTVSGTGYYKRSDSATAKAFVKPGCQFDRWMEVQEEGAQAVEVSTDSIYKFHVSGSRVLTAYFSRIQVPRYDVSLSVNDSTLGTVEGAGSYRVGDYVEVKALPKAKALFDAWYEGETKISEDAIYGFSMPAAAKNLKAVFSVRPAKKYQLTVEINNTAWGSVKGAGEYTEGETITLTAEPTEKNKFVEWQNEASSKLSTDLVYVFEMPSEDIIYKAIFGEGTSIEVAPFAGVQIYGRNGSVYVENLSSMTRVELVDMMGRVLESRQSNLSCEIKAPKAGVYVIRMNNAKGSFSQKMMIK